MKVSRLPAALAYKLIRRGCSPADLATLAMLWPRGGHVPQQTKAGRAINSPCRVVGSCPTTRLPCSVVCEARARERDGGGRSQLFAPMLSCQPAKFH